MVRVGRRGNSERCKNNGPSHERWRARAENYAELYSNAAGCAGALSEPGDQSKVITANTSAVSAANSATFPTFRTRAIAAISPLNAFFMLA